ncbi:hypothetical protein WB66_24480 [bacteria symbiont BFo1 of Frankliniella occidentalis]|nr:hypothetical protein WB66_24480 [bacteria symbiont BFo1 of Frankliniella occidentalis]
MLFRHAEAATAPPTLIGPNDIEARLPVNTKLIDRPFGMVDGLNGATTTALVFRLGTLLAASCQ